MKPEVTETTGRDGTVCIQQHYRLICIHDPGRKTGLRITARSRKAVVQQEEQKAENIVPGPELPVSNGEPVQIVQTAPENSISRIPAGSNEIRPQVPEGHANLRQEIPAGSGDLIPGTPQGSAGPGQVILATSGNPGPGTLEGCTDPVPGLPATSGNLKPQEPEGNNNSSPEQPAPETTAGDAS